MLFATEMQLNDSTFLQKVK